MKRPKPVKPQHGTKITRLSNSHYYFLTEALIIKEEFEDYKFRLIVLHGTRLLADRRYTNTRGAKIAFSRMFNNARWKESINPFWPEFYAADETWFEKRKCVILEAGKPEREDVGKPGSWEARNIGG